MKQKDKSLKQAIYLELLMSQELKRLMRSPISLTYSFKDVNVKYGDSKWLA